MSADDEKQVVTSDPKSSPPAELVTRGGRRLLTREALRLRAESTRRGDEFGLPVTSCVGR